MAAANLCEIVLPVARGIGLAHLLTPEQFGIALTITITASIVELMTDLGASQMALKVTTAVGLDTLHSVSVIRGVLIGTAIAAAGPFFASIFHTATSWAYIVAGLSSVIRGFAHLETRSNMREYNFYGEALNSISAQFVWTVVSIGLAFIYHDYRAMAFGFLAFTISILVVTHLVARRPWRLGWDKSTARDAMKFGGPLALNGIAYTLTNLGDRALTGATISLEQLAEYTALATSAFLPRSAVLKYLNSVFTPHFVNAKTTEQEARLGSIWLIVLSTIAGIFGLGYFAFGQFATTFVFGQSYHPTQAIVSLIALLGTIRYASGLPMPPTLASGQSGILVRATLLSVSGLVLGGVLLLMARTLNSLVFGLALGECVSLVWVTLRVCGMTGVSRRLALVSMLWPVASLAFLAAIAHVAPEQARDFHGVLLISGCFCQAAVTAWGCWTAAIGPMEAFGTVFPHRVTNDSG